MTDLDLTIEELVIPASLSTDASAAVGAAADFVAMVAVRNAVEAEIIGSDALAYGASELLPLYQNQEYDPKRVLVARLGGQIVGRGVLEWPVEDEDGARIAWISAEVLSSFRGRGIGTRLVDRLEELALTDNRTIWQSYQMHANPPEGTPVDRLESPTGFGSAPMSDPGVRFLRRRGYRLEQVERISFLDLPVDPDELAHHLGEAERAAGPDYRIVRWRGPTPERWIADLVTLRTRMSTDMPAAGMTVVEEAWTADRIVKHDTNSEAGGREVLTVAAEHLPTGTLAGFSQLSIPSDRSRPVGQEDTLVLSEHRGHRLGMLLKIANIQHLAKVNPSSPLISTFNAEENRHMLSVNEAVGFRAVGVEGAWKKTAPEV